LLTRLLYSEKVQTILSGMSTQTYESAGVTDFVLITEFVRTASKKLGYHQFPGGAARNVKGAAMSPLSCSQRISGSQLRFLLSS